MDGRVQQSRLSRLAVSLCDALPGVNMDLRALLFLAGCCTLICCGQSTRNHLHLNITDTQAADESPLPIKERFRRLIPYMTFYLDQGYNTQSQYVTQTPQDFQTIQTVNNNLQQQPYFLPPQYQQPKVQLVPLGYLVGGGYRRTPVYSRPTQPDYSQVPYTHQHSTDLTRMVTQNYLSMPKPMNDHTQDQRPAQYTTKLQYTNLNQYQNPLSVPKTKLSQNKVYYQPRHRFYQTANRQPYSLKNYRPSYTNTPPKDDSYTHLHNNYEVNYQSTPKIKNYEPSPEVMTIAKSQEINFSEEESLEPSPIALTLPETTTSNIPQIQTEYEQSTPIQTTEDQNNLLDILTSYQLSKVLPEKVTPSNIGYSIRTLSNILKLLQKAKAQTNEPALDDEGDNYENGVNQNYSPYQTEGSTPGRAGIDYPAYSEIPETHFSCKSQRYKGFFGDPETNCQVWHYCDLNGGQASFLCPNGTIFSQVALTCDWWFNVKCASTAQLYVLNERLYKYILPVKPSFPEDYAGPLVDEYLTLKFQELEAKKENTTTTEKTTSTLQVLLNDEINQAVK